MSPVGGPRHYVGAGLGQVGLWGCPRCGKDNEGPIEGGCVHCGSGKPVAAPRVSERTPDDPTYQQPPPSFPSPQIVDVAPVAVQASVEQNEFTAWQARHPNGTVEQAFIAGYIEGVRAARREMLAARPPQPGTPAPGATPIEDPRTYRTMVAALAMFRDQILSGDPEEAGNGEWLTYDEATSVIQQLQEQLAHG